MNPPDAAVSFREFVFRSKRNRTVIISGIAAAVCCFIIFKLLYPFPSFYADSYFYILAAKNNVPVDMWPVGYSKVLILIHAISAADNFLISIQYLSLVISTWYLVLTVLWIYRPARWASAIFFAWCVINPLYLYIGNIVSSDALFIACSIWWLALLIRVLYQAKPVHIFMLSFITAIAFILRYNALYYPVVAVLAVLLAKVPRGIKCIGILGVFLFSGAFIQYTRKMNGQVAGVEQFSGFSSWQLANNALYMYPYVHPSKETSPDPEIRKIDGMVRAFFDTLPPGMHIGPQDGAWFMLDQRGPLKAYMFNRWVSAADKPLVWIYNVTSVPIGAYGKRLISRYPLAYARYFLLPNAAVYLMPPLEQLEQYNQGIAEVHESALQWFHYKTAQVYGWNDDAQAGLMLACQLLFVLVNIMFFTGLPVLFYFYRYWKTDNIYKRPVILMVVLFVLNTVFSIMASPSVFRYQVFQLLLGLILLVLLTEIILGIGKKADKNSL
ncbi:MAG TPA: hypothetical protein VM802_23335 [Chitinophaga sp.]|uniref:hypothetical protein n=1 Tax=Chitinophaga sp. TaxID=1869181 RepID=UPI002BBD9B79|nr:hypothetical protein [Chitinophaga sp.]HVI47822.1 hypothetical protein [Chitinophaga sp.]